MRACARRVDSPAKAPRYSVNPALLALAERRTDEQIEADAEIERISRDEPDEIVKAWQDAIGACGTFFDLWARRNNLPIPPCPGHAAMELAGRDLVAEQTTLVVSRQVVLFRRRITTDEQLSLL